MYKEFKIRKRTGGFRTIEAPDDSLKEEQRELLGKLQHLNMHDSAIAYRDNRNVVDGIMRIWIAYNNLYETYSGNLWILKMDIKDFFNSITKEKFEYINFVGEERYKEEILKLAFCPCHNWLPQGSPLSGFVSNLYMKRLDEELSKTVKDEYEYVRYADDMYFIVRSFQVSKRMKSEITATIEEAGFKLNHKKTQLRKLSTTKYMNILGVRVFLDRLVVPKRTRKRLRAMEHQGNTDSANGLRGWIEYIERRKREYQALIVSRVLTDYKFVPY